MKKQKKLTNSQCKAKLRGLKGKLSDAEYDYERVWGDKASLDKVRSIKGHIKKLEKKCAKKII